MMRINWHASFPITVPMDAPLFTALFSFTGVFYGLLAPLVLLQLVALLLIASMLQPGAQPKGVVQAIFCYVLQAVGIIFMTGGALPTIMSVLAARPLAGSTYFALLILFTAGGLLFLWQDDALRKVDDVSRRVPAALFKTLYKLLGFLIVFFWTLSFMMTIITGLPDDTSWWIMPAVMILYGGVFVWCTKEPGKGSTPALFRSMSMNRAPMARSIAAKAVSSKKSGRR